MGGGFHTGIAQLVEHRSPKPRVVGSSPPSRARKELTHSAVVVLSASLIIALVVWAMDFVFKSFMSLVYPA